MTARCLMLRRTTSSPGEHPNVAAGGAGEELLRGEDVDVDAVRALAAGGVHYVGSDTTGVVCFPTCHHARRIAPSHRRGFGRVAAALAAGYRPCRHCRPAVPA